MATPRPPVPALLVVAAFSRHEDAFVAAREAMERSYGPVALAGEPFLFDQTAYYEPTMGAGLRKQLWAFHDLIALDRLPELKHHTNALEASITASGVYPETRPINLDPGYLVLGKFLLATTKDQAHRVYLREGIYAEVTLHYHAGAFHPWEWTYADYRLPGVLAFLAEARTFYRGRLASARGLADPLS
jgi:Domain of unknown function (DUF4416)